MWPGGAVADGHVETYSYTNDGYLQTITTGGVLGAVRTMDLLGRVTLYTEYQSNGTSVLSTRDVTFDGDNRVTAETDITYGSGVTYTSQITNDYRLFNGSTYTGADQGVLTHTRKVQSQSGSSTTTTIDSDYSYVWWGQAKTSVITVKANSTEWLPGKSTFTYDVNGHLTSNKDGESNGVNRLISYTTDAFGQVLTREESGNGKPGAKRTYFYLNGRTLGDVGTDKDSNVDYAQQLATNRTSAANAGTTTISTNNAATPVVGLNGNFDANYDAFNPSSVAQAGSSYTAVGGEGLQAAALSVWGDASLWYLLAEANGLDAGATLVAGQVLSVPNAVSNVHNNSGTFKPYNALEAQGNTLPTLPRQPQPPARQGCGAIGQIIVVIIAVVVTAIVAPYATAAVANMSAGASLGTAVSTAFAATSTGAYVTGAAVAAGTAASVGWGAAVAGGAIAGLAGGVASQTFAVATGIQSKFDWSAVAMGAIAGGVGGGMGTLIKGSTFLAGAARGLATSVVSQGVNMAVGLQKKFDWTSVAVAGVTGGVGAKIGSWAESRFGKIGGGALAGSASALAGAATHSLLTRQSFGQSLKEALPGAIGTTIGNMISGAIADASGKRADYTVNAQSDDSGFTAVSEGNGSRSQSDVWRELAQAQGYDGVELAGSYRNTQGQNIPTEPTDKKTSELKDTGRIVDGGDLTPEGASTANAHVYTSPDGQPALGWKMEDGGAFYIGLGKLADFGSSGIYDLISGEEIDFFPITPAEHLGRNPATEVIDTPVNMALPALSAPEGNVQTVTRAINQAIASVPNLAGADRPPMDKVGSIFPFVATAMTQFNFSMNASSGYPEENKLNFLEKVEHPGTWESLIPIWGSGKEAVAYFQEGNYGAAAFYTVMAASDVFLVKSIGTAAGKGLLRIAGSHSWPATREWMIKNGYKNLVGRQGHHWLLHQKQGLGKYAPEWLKNQPWNIKILTKESHIKAHHGNALEKYWYGTPDGIKALKLSVGGRATKIGQDDTVDKNQYRNGNYEE